MVLSADFARQGHAVLRSFAAVEGLSREFDATMAAAFEGSGGLNSGGAGNSFRYVPTMGERTPEALAMLTRLAPVAAELLGAPVLPGRAKATEYFGTTRWHRDSTLPIDSLGAVFYLDVLDAGSGALQVRPGSHRWEELFATPGAASGDGVALPTVPGDGVVFHERLLHASAGGARRRQWRIDFVADRPEYESLLRAYFAAQYTPGWDGGYDPDRFPSYGEAWLSLDARWTRRMEELGVLEAAEKEAAFMRWRRASAAKP